LFRDLITWILVKGMVAVGRHNLRVMHRNTKNARRINEKLLMRIVRWGSERRMPSRAGTQQASRQPSCSGWAASEASSSAQGGGASSKISTRQAPQPRLPPQGA